MGYDYPSLNKKKIVGKRIKPKKGDLILFPSSLFHGTIPTTSGNDRISLESIVVFGDIKMGDDYNAEDVNLLIKKLYETNFFSNIQVKIAEGE